MSKKDTNGQVPESDLRDQEVQEQNTAPASGSEAPEAAADAVPIELEQLRQELGLTKDQLLRQAAEYKNFRRRTEKERAQLLDRGRSDVIERMLDVLDDFRRALEAAGQAEQQDEAGPAYQALKQGVEMVYQKLSDELIKLGVERIEAEGQPFDEHLHEALMSQPAPEGTAPGTVLHEIQRGYRLGDRVLRHAKVVVAA